MNAFLYEVTALPPGRRAESYVCEQVVYEGTNVTLGGIQGQPDEVVILANVPAVVRRVPAEALARAPGDPATDGFLPEVERRVVQRLRRPSRPPSRNAGQPRYLPAGDDLAFDGKPDREGSWPVGTESPFAESLRW